MWRLNVVTEIKNWSRQVLEKPSTHFNGLPPCPYARQAWSSESVKVDFGNAETIIKHCNNWDEKVELLIVVAENWDFKKLEEWCEEQNNILAKDDLTLMAFVPDDDAQDTGQPIEEQENWDSLIEELYAMVFIQRLSLVNGASKKLERKGYYKNCTAEFLEYVFKRRKRTE
ncbi:MAG: hypothetical protein Unbinned3138contig1001_39 [Prokaryotic dsDNA virus sp.]|nr:MAG: hypothetical protein Unbinned3138contig1001_39 [Prokaryotic dsDNA virus sp.]